MENFRSKALEKPAIESGPRGRTTRMFRRNLDWGNTLDDLKDLTFLTVNQSASILNCPKKTVYYWIEQGNIQIYRFGRRKGIRIKHDDLQNFIESKRETAPGVPNGRF